MSTTKEKNGFNREIRKDLTLALLARADHAGETMRVLLFTASGAALGFVLIDRPSVPVWHLVPVLLFIAAAVVVFFSWRLQKEKAIARFNAALTCGVQDYVELQSKWQEEQRFKIRPEWGLNWFSNMERDVLAAGLLLSGVALEVIFWIAEV